LAQLNSSHQKVRFIHFAKPLDWHIKTWGICFR